MGELGGRGGGVVVVVQSLAGGDEGEPLEVARGVVVGPATEVVGDRVHRRRAAEVDVDVDEGGEQPDLPSEHHDEHGDAEGETEQGVVVEQPVHAGRRKVLGVAGDRRGVPRLPPVHRDVEHLHLDPPVEHGGVRVALDVGERVVLAVHRHPLPGPDAGGHPRDDPKCLGGRPAQGERPVRERPVQVDRGRGVGDQAHGHADDEAEDEDSHHRGEGSRTTYWSVGRRGHYLDEVSGDPPIEVHEVERTPAAPPVTRSTRELILDEAVACFGSTGYEGTSLNDIAAGVGIRRPSLLHHFPSKEALYGEVFERLLSDWFARLDEAVASDEHGLGQGRAGAARRIRLLRRQPGLRAPGAPRGDRRREPTSGSTWRRSCARCSTSPSSTSSGRWPPGRSATTIREQLLITGYGALLSYFSDAPFLEGLIAIDPLDPRALERRRDHILAFFHAALVP